MLKRTTLGEYYDVRDGTHDSPKYIKEGFPLVTSKNLKDGKIDLTKIKFISEKDYLNINKRSRVDVGDVLMAMIGTIGNPVEIIDHPQFAIKNVALFKVNEQQSSAYLKYFLSHPSTVSKMMRDAKGTTQKFVGLGYLRKFPIEIPSLPEQQRIVAKLDAAFAEIDKVIKISKNNLKSAETFFARKNSHTFNIFKNNSKIISINNVCKNIFAGGDAPKTSFSKIKNKKFNIPIYANAKKDKGLYGYTDVPRVDVPAITIAGRGNVGYTEIREEPFFPIVRLIVLIPNEDLISIKFLKRSILSLDILSSGSAIPQLTVPMIKNYVIPLPSLDKQKKYVEKINKIEEQVFKICDCYSKKISQLEILKSQILFKELKN